MASCDARRRRLRCKYRRLDASVGYSEEDVYKHRMLTVVTERWTNNRYRSTMHRVISPVSGRDRYSCAFFNEGQLDRMIECIPTCLKAGDEPLYEPVKVEDHLMKRYRQSYGAAGTEL